MKTHWFPLRPAIRAGYFLGVKVALGGWPWGSHYLDRLRCLDFVGVPGANRGCLL